MKPLGSNEEYPFRTEILLKREYDLVISTGVKCFHVSNVCQMFSRMSHGHEKRVRYAMPQKLVAEPFGI